MEHQKLLNLLNEANDSKFVTRKWNIVNDHSKKNYDATNEITFNTAVLKSTLCDYNNAYIFVIGDMTIIRHGVTQVAFTKCITKIDETKIDYAKNLDLVMPMNNLIEYSSNYSETTGTLCFYSKDEVNNFNADIANDNYFNSFKYKTKLIGNTVADGPNEILKNSTIYVPLKYLSNFWGSLEMSLINCKVELKLKWTK